MEIIKLSKKQHLALQILNDKVTTELFYGGGAGGGKSFLGCLWLVSCCLAYPGTRYLMGRAILKSIKESTLLTFFQVCKEVFHLEAGKDYVYNSMEGRVKFPNGSEVFLKDLFLYPSDPEFDSLGSTEYTAAFIDEVSEITEKAKNIVMSRLRYKLDDYGLIPKLLLASNPAKNFAYRVYYMPYKEGKLPTFRAFIPALVTDNPYISKYYAENLEKLDKNSKERLLYGNWEYDDDPSRLFEYEMLLEIFTKKNELNGDTKYISCDVARFGPDKTIIIVWKGLFMQKVYSFPKTSTKQTREYLEKLSSAENIPYNRIIIDEDGIGGGVVDEMMKVKGFVNNSSPLEHKQIPSKVYTKPKIQNFANLKTQCYFLLADYVNKGKLGCEDIKPEYQQQIIGDLEQVKWHNPNKDEKIRITPKEDIKENLGRSPDFGDAMMMRMFFELKQQYKPYISV